MKQSNSKSKRGGFRPNAGRKKREGEASKNKTFYVPLSIYDEFTNLASALKEELLKKQKDKL